MNLAEIRDERAAIRHDITVLTERDAQLAKLQRAMESLPRDAPCPCGSGEKFKRCCLKRKDGE